MLTVSSSSASCFSIGFIIGQVAPVNVRASRQKTSDLPAGPTCKAAGA